MTLLLKRYQLKQRPRKKNPLSNVDLTKTIQRNPCYAINSSTIYIPTLKCAKTWCQNLLVDLGYSETTVRSAPTVLIVTRDPLSRWRSGIVTYMRIWHSDIKTGAEFCYTLDSLLEKSLILDSHTVPQCSYIADADPANILAFDILNVEQTLPHYLNVNISNNRYKNTTQEHSYMRWADQFMPKYLDRYSNDLVELYSCDYVLLRDVQYYTMPEPNV